MISKEAENTIWTKIKLEAGIKIGERATKALVKSFIWPEYHPVREFIATLKGQRPNGLLNQFCALVETDLGMNVEADFNPYLWPDLFKKWYVSMIATVLSDEPENNPMFLALLGGQGTGKTEMLRRLLPVTLQKYYGEHKVSNSRDFWAFMKSKILVVDDEMIYQNKTEQEAFKALMSKNFIEYRKLFTDDAESFRRTATVAGTGNDYFILRDITGNRRYIPVKVLSIDWEKQNEIDKDLMFIEAYNLYRQKDYSYRLTIEEIKILAKHNEEFLDEKIEESVMNEYLVPIEFNDPDAIYYHQHYIFSKLEMICNVKLSYQI